MTYLIAFLLIATTFAGCNASAKNETDGNIRVLATTFPQYDWARQIIGERNDKVELTLLVDSGIDLHSFQPSVEDITKISNCDMFIYTGGISDSWVADALDAGGNKDRIEINLLEILGSEVKEEEEVEGMQGEVEHEHSHEDAHGEHESDIDEHVWLSLKNAQRFTDHIAGKLGDLDVENASTYKNNATKYIEKLDELDSKFEDVVGNASKRTLLFGDRFPFRYLVDDYDLDYYAAFVGCSAETEASFETIVFLANKVDELGLNYVMALETSNHSIAKTIVDNTKGKNQNILVLDSIQSVSSDSISSDISYLSLMEENYEVIKKALE